MRSIKRYTPAIAILAVSMLFTACAGGMAGSRAGAAGAMYEWDKGTTVTYEIMTVQTTALEVPGAGEQAMASTSSMILEVVSTGPRSFDVTFKDASTSSDQVDPTGMVPDVSELIGEMASITLDRQGKIVESSGMEDNPYTDFIGTEAFLDQTLQVLFQILPEGKLVEEAEWGREYNYPFGIMGLELEMANSEKYQCLEARSYEGRSAFRIGNSGESSLSGGGEIQGNMMDMMLSGSGEGSTWIEADTGKVLASEMTMKMGGGIFAGGMDIPMSMEMKVTITVKDQE